MVSGENGGDWGGSQLAVMIVMAWVVSDARRTMVKRRGWKAD